MAKMKNSNIPWIGEIPEHWKVAKINKLFNIKAGGDVKSEIFSDNYSEEYQFPIYTNSTDKNYIYGYSKIAFYPAGAITVTGRGDIGFAVYRDRPFDAIIRLLVLTKKANIDERYYTYFINEIFKFDSSSSAINQLSAVQLAPHIACIPPLSEQQKIADYLDNKTALIEERINIEKEQITKLKEYRKSLISEAVTKGLDKNAKLKDSGIEWIGGIPEGWKTGQIRNILKIITDYTANGSFADLAKNVEYLDFQDYARLVRLTDLRLNLENNGVYVNEVGYNFLSKSALYGGEILLANVGAYAGLACEMPYTDIKATLAPNMFLMKFEKNINNHFIFYVLNSLYIQEQLAMKANSTSAQPKLNKDDVRSIRITFPPVEEQQKIADYLDAKTNEIDKAISQKEMLIEKLGEYKKSLIYEVVTGKMEI